MNRPGLKTSEFAEFCGTTRDTLLWYDKTGVLKPNLVGENGYRYYSTRQFLDYDLISVLKQSGSSIREIKLFLEKKQRTPLKVLFEEKSRRLGELIDDLSRMKQFADDIAGNITEAESCEPGKPELMDLQESWMAVTPVQPSEEWLTGNEHNCLYEHLRNYARSPGVCRYPLGSVISKESFLAGSCADKFIFSETTRQAGGEMLRRPAGRYVRIYHKGSMGKVLDTLRIVRDYLGENGLCVCGDIFEYDVLTFLMLDSEDDFVLKFLFPVTELSH